MLVIIPQKKNIIFLQSMLHKVTAGQVKEKVVKPAVTFRAKEEVMRWLSDEGRITSWKKQKKYYSFVWVGSYQAMLSLVAKWPNDLKVQAMHWEKRNMVGIKWSGRYAIDD